ncbi:MAG: exodeoxyribonuclease III [Rhodospirillaceae bacterium]
MKIATWNINSVRLRIDLLMRLIEETAPDVICLQETKVVDDAFPLKPLAERGYHFTHIDGQKSYNGVAILSRLRLDKIGVHSWCERRDCRHISAELPGGIELHCVYIPSGGDIPDPGLNEKFAHKLRFLDEITAWFASARRPEQPIIMVGDFNIAPLEADVWSHRLMLDVVSHTPVEVAKLGALQRSLGWTDCGRAMIPANRKLYTWWSYRAKDWNTSDRGRRLDHIWHTPGMAGTLRDCATLRSARGWEPKPSDHVPVIAELDV